MTKIARVALCVAVVGLGGCATRHAAATSQAASAYASSFAAPDGSARVYILPTHSKGMFSDLGGRADLLIFPADSERGAELGSTATTAFIAFDIAPGDYDLVAHGGDSFSKVTRLESFAAGRTYFLRPTFFRSAKDLDAASGMDIDAASGSDQAKTGMGFDVVDPATAEAEIGRLAMVRIPPLGAAFLRQTYPGVAAPAAAAAPPPQAQPAPAPVDATLEGKLRTLQRLRDEGLITQPEYDSKRQALLDAY